MIQYVGTPIHKYNRRASKGKLFPLPLGKRKRKKKEKLSWWWSSDFSLFNKANRRAHLYIHTQLLFERFLFIFHAFRKHNSTTCIALLIGVKREDW